MRDVGKTYETLEYRYKTVIQFQIGLRYANNFIPHTFQNNRKKNYTTTTQVSHTGDKIYLSRITTVRLR